MCVAEVLRSCESRPACAFG